MFESNAKGFLNLRGAVPDLRAGVASILGVDVPATPCTFVRAEAVAIYWLGPDEWLAMVPNGRETELAARLRDAVAGHCAIADVSGGHVLFSLAADARAVLAQSSPCDFHPRAFPPGRCRQTIFAKTHALIAANADDCFDLIVRRSYADYVRAWLATCLREPP